MHVYRTDNVERRDGADLPTDVGTAMVAVFDDTCGNLIQIVTETS